MKKQLRLLLLTLMAVLMSGNGYAGDVFSVILDGGATQSSDGYFTITDGGGYNAKYTGTYNGREYKKGLKMNSSSKIEFETTSASKVIMVQSLFLPPDRSWILNWCSASHFVKVKSIQIAVCSLVALLPFLVLLLVGGLSWTVVVSVYFAATIWLIETEMLRFTMSDSPILMFVVMIPLVSIAYFSVGIPYVFILSVMVLAWIMFGGYSYISNVIEND